MELALPLIIIPPIIALMAKGTIYAYAHYSKTHNRQTRLYLLFLFSFSVQNIAEIFGLYKVNVNHVIAYFEVTLFYIAVIIALAVFFHLALSVAFDEIRGIKRASVILAYLYAALLTTLLTFTPSLIRDFEVFKYSFGLSVTRVPGPLYFLFELHVFALLIGSVGVLSYGSRKQNSAPKRAKNLMLLLAIVPTVITGLLIVGLLHFGIKWFNTSVIFPITITYFLALTAYATYQYRIFDIQFFLPWSKVRKRKTAFYNRIRAMVAELADLGSVNQVVNRLADLLRCPVALIGGPRPVLVMAGEAFGMARFPHEALQKIEHIVVANEIAEAMPETHALMTRHKVGAIVPFHPHSQTAASWMLLGEHFSEQVYTPLDFKMVEQLFDRMAELFLDKLLLMRIQLAEAHREMRALHQRLAISWETQEELRKENRSLREQNAQLMSERITSVQASVLSPAGDEAGSTKVVKLFAPGERTLEEYVAEFETRIIKQVLKRCGGNQSKAARLLGLRPNTLFYKIERFGLSDKKDPE